MHGTAFAGTQRRTVAGSHAGTRTLEDRLSGDGSSGSRTRRSTGNGRRRRPRRRSFVHGTRPGLRNNHPRRRLAGTLSGDGRHAWPRDDGLSWPRHSRRRRGRACFRDRSRGGNRGSLHALRRRRHNTRRRHCCRRRRCRCCRRERRGRRCRWLRSWNCEYRTRRSLRHYQTRGRRRRRRGSGLRRSRHVAGRGGAGLRRCGNGLGRGNSLRRVSITWWWRRNLGRTRRRGRSRYGSLLLTNGAQNVPWLRDMREIDLRLELVRLGGVAASRSLRLRIGAGSHKSAHLFRFKIFERTGVSLLFSDSDLRQHIENSFTFYFQLPSQIVDSNLAHPSLCSFWTVR